MTKAFCTDCGIELELGAKYCANCGALANLSRPDQGQQGEQIQTQATQHEGGSVLSQQEGPMQLETDMKVPVQQYSHNQNQSYSQKQYTEPSQGYVRTSEKNETLSVFGYVITMLALMVPIVGIILVFVWAFGTNTNLARKNYSRAVLIIAIIFIVFGITIFATLSTALIPLFEAFSRFY